MLNKLRIFILLIAIISLREFEDDTFLKQDDTEFNHEFIRNLEY